MDDAWMNRSRLFVENMVVMVCPIPLAVALKKVNLKSKEHGCSVPITMLIAAAVTLIASICSFLVCCLSKSKMVSSTSPHTVTMILAPTSTTCLVALACWIIRLVIPDIWAYPAIGIVVALCIVIRTFRYYAQTAETRDAIENQEYFSKLENSLEFSAGIAALLFVGLAGLALEGEISSDKGTQHHLNGPMGACFITCLVAACLMLLHMVPPLNTQFCLTEISDITMTFEVSMVMFFIMYELVKLRALILLASPFLVLMVHLFHVAVDNGTSGDGGDEEYRPASLELTKATFAGFLAVSIPSISNGSLDIYTEMFLQFGAAAILAGLIWRPLTHIKSCTAAATANHASFFTHLFVAIATVPFTIMARNAL